MIYGYRYKNCGLIRAKLDHPIIAALFVDPAGPYFGRSDVDSWDEFRDARLYTGPWPVVAHPPCHLWTNLAAVNFKRYGGEHNRPGNDEGCFEHALWCVRAFGGVLEHPAHSQAWKAFGLKAPKEAGWNQVCPGEWTAEVWQSAYGHKARKKTWLFYRGLNPPAPALWSRSPGTHQCGWFDRKKPALGKKEASRTPQKFADYLISLARGSVTI